MIAFVLSGGANRGAMEVGALDAMLRAGIRPDILVGSSVGGVNALLLATDPTPAGVARLTDFWLGTSKDDVAPGSLLTMSYRLVRGRSLFPGTAVRATLAAALPPKYRRFGDLQGVRLYLTAANLNTGALYLYGDDADASLLDAVLASAAHPLLFPPVETDGLQLVDGGVAANVPVGIAADRGATEVYVLDLGSGVDPSPAATMLGRVGRSIALMMRQTFLMDLRLVLERTGTVVHHLPLTGFTDLPMTDTSQIPEMIAHGRRIAESYLADPAPLTQIPGGVPDGSQAPPGARVYEPRYLRPSDLLDLPDIQRMVSTELARRGDSTLDGLATSLGLPPRVVAEALADLISRGNVERTADGQLRVILGGSRARPLVGDLLAGLE